MRAGSGRLAIRCSKLHQSISADVGQSAGSTVMLFMSAGSTAPTRDSASSAASFRNTRSVVCSGGVVESVPLTKRRSASSMSARTRSGSSRPAAVATERTYAVSTSLPSVLVGKYFKRPFESAYEGRAVATSRQSASSCSAIARDTRCSRQRYG